MVVHNRVSARPAARAAHNRALGADTLVCSLDTAQAAEARHNPAFEAVEAAADTYLSSFPLSRTRRDGARRAGEPDGGIGPPETHGRCLYHSVSANGPGRPGRYLKGTVIGSACQAVARIPVARRRGALRASRAP